MTKRSQGRRRFCRRNFKQRYFRLTTQSLSYAKSKGKNAICDIPLSEILAVERLNERSFKMQNIFQVSSNAAQMSNFYFVLSCGKSLEMAKNCLQLSRHYLTTHLYAIMLNLNFAISDKKPQNIFKHVEHIFYFDEPVHAQQITTTSQTMWIEMVNQYYSR